MTDPTNNKVLFIDMCDQGPMSGPLDREPYVTYAILQPVVTVERFEEYYHISARFNLQTSITGFEKYQEELQPRPQTAILLLMLCCREVRSMLTFSTPPSSSTNTTTEKTSLPSLVRILWDPSQSQTAPPLVTKLRVLLQLHESPLVPSA
jgi:hypothetical protein